MRYAPKPDLDVHPVFPTRDLALEDQYSALKLSLYLNGALCALKLSTPLAAADARTAIKHATSALNLAGNPETDQGKRVLTDAEKAKALYRRAVAELAVKEEAAAISDLEAAAVLVPTDAAIQKESVPLLFLVASLTFSQICRLAGAKKSVEAKKAKSRAAYSKMFSS